MEMPNHDTNINVLALPKLTINCDFQVQLDKVFVDALAVFNERVQPLPQPLCTGGMRRACDLS